MSFEIRLYLNRGDTTPIFQEKYESMQEFNKINTLCIDRLWKKNDPNIYSGELHPLSQHLISQKNIHPDQLKTKTLYVHRIIKSKNKDNSQYFKVSEISNNLLLVGDPDNKIKRYSKNKQYDEDAALSKIQKASTHETKNTLTIETILMEHMVGC